MCGKSVVVLLKVQGLRRRHRFDVTNRFTNGGDVFAGQRAVFGDRIEIAPTTEDGGAQSADKETHERDYQLVEMIPAFLSQPVSLWSGVCRIHANHFVVRRRLAETRQRAWTSTRRGVVPRGVHGGLTRVT